MPTNTHKVCCGTSEQCDNSEANLAFVSFSSPNSLPCHPAPTNEKLQTPAHACRRTNVYIEESESIVAACEAITSVYVINGNR